MMDNDQIFNGIRKRQENYIKSLFNDVKKQLDYMVTQSVAEKENEKADKIHDLIEKKYASINEISEKIKDYENRCLELKRIIEDKKSKIEDTNNAAMKGQLELEINKCYDEGRQKVAEIFELKNKLEELKNEFDAKQDELIDRYNEEINSIKNNNEEYLKLIIEAYKENLSDEDFRNLIDYIKEKEPEFYDKIQDVLNGNNKDKGESFAQNYSISELVEEIKRLNPNKSIAFDDFILGERIVLDDDVSNYKLPEGWYYNEKNGLTNKHNTKTGMYNSYDVEMPKKDKSNDLETATKLVEEAEKAVKENTSDKEKKIDTALAAVDKLPDNAETQKLRDRLSNLVINGKSKDDDKDKNNNDENIIDDFDDLFDNQVLSDTDASMPVVKGNKPKLTWKTALAVAAGVGIGCGVFFGVGPIGVAAIPIAGMIAKHFIKKKRKALAEQQSLGMPSEIDQMEVPEGKIKKALFNMKKYFNSEEGLRDMEWLINSAIITGSALTIGSKIYSLVEAAKAPVVSTTPVSHASGVQVPDTSPTSGTTNSLFDNIKLGGSVDGYNVSHGHLNALDASNGIDTKTLIGKYVNGDSSVFKRVFVNDGGVMSEIKVPNGTSLTDIISKYGYDPSQIVFDVSNKGGVSQAWISAEELTSGGMSI